MTTSARTRYTGYRFPAEIIGHAVWPYFPAGGRVYLQIVRLLLVALRQVENVHRAPDAAFVNRDRGALPVAGAGGVEFHGSPLVSLVIRNRAIIRVATREREL